MCSDYYFKIRRKSFELDSQACILSRTISDNEANNAEVYRNNNSKATNYIGDEKVDDCNVEYQQVFEDYDKIVEEHDEQCILKSTVLTKTNSSSINEQSNKLYLNLSSDKIALKSQTEKINKSIGIEEEGSQQKHLTQLQMPVTFTIVPKQQQKEQEQQEQPHHHHQQKVHEQLQQSNRDKHCREFHKFPEIVLTSFRGNMNSESSQCSNASTSAINNKKKTNSKVTFQASSTFNSQSNLTTPFNKQLRDDMIYKDRIKSLPLPLTVATAATDTTRPTNSSHECNTEIILTRNLNLKENEINEITMKKHGSEENNSQQGSSISPESIMDNVLSAASSVSVRSSSLSSNCGINPIDINAIELRKQIKNKTASNNGVNGGSEDSISSSLGSSHQQIPLTPIITVKGNLDKIEEKTFKRSLNSNTNRKQFQIPTIITTTTTTTTRTTSLLSSSIQCVGSNITTPTFLNAMPCSESLQPPERQFDIARSIQSRSSSPSISVGTHLTAIDNAEKTNCSIPEEIKCSICSGVYREPKTLNCLHSFCLQCLIDANFKDEPNNANQWKGNSKSSFSIRSQSPETSLRSGSDEGTSSSSTRRRISPFSFRRKKSQEHNYIQIRPETKPRTTEQITCKLCNFNTDLPIGGIRQIHTNLMLVRKVQQFKLKGQVDVRTQIWCSLCYVNTNAIYHCTECTLNLCRLCKEAHERQRSTAKHSITNIMDTRKLCQQKEQQHRCEDKKKYTIKCDLHPGHEVRSFCTHCLEVACSDCLLLLHIGHKHESISRAFSTYSKLLQESIDKTRTVWKFTEHSMKHLNDITKGINRKCDDIQNEVETFLNQYFDALELHKQILLQQITRARESKIEMVMQQQVQLEKRNNDYLETVRFSQELTENAADVEILSFLKLLLRRFAYCRQPVPIRNPKISETLRFLPELRAPFMKNQNNIPLFGVVSMQIVDPAHCSLLPEDMGYLRLHKPTELVLQTRDSDGVALCHGGLQINAHLKYKEAHSKYLPIEVFDQRDGTYSITFTPDAEGTLELTISINAKPIKGSPFTIKTRNVRPHSGIYHCCTFCSSKGKKITKCSCGGRMPGTNGCGHGHPGHPGHRHWSCCGNVLEKSECNETNNMFKTNDVDSPLKRINKIK